MSISYMVRFFCSHAAHILDQAVWQGSVGGFPIVRECPYDKPGDIKEPPWSLVLVAICHFCDFENHLLLMYRQFDTKWFLFRDSLSPVVFANQPKIL